MPPSPRHRTPPRSPTSRPLPALRRRTRPPFRRVPTQASAVVLADSARRVRDALESYFRGEFDDATKKFRTLSHDMPNNGYIWAFLGASQYSQYAFEADDSLQRPGDGVLPQSQNRSANGTAGYRPSTSRDGFGRCSTARVRRARVCLRRANRRRMATRTVAGGPSEARDHRTRARDEVSDPGRGRGPCSRCLDNSP